MPHTQRVVKIVEAVERRSGLVVENDEGKLIAISTGTDIVGR
jgi:hypothetical protein